MQSRRRFSAVLRDFSAELERLSRLDRDNQRRLTTRGCRLAAGAISRRQLYMLTEAILFYAYRSYENFVHDVFVLHCLEKPNLAGRKARSYLRPKTFLHAEELMQSSLRFLDWSNPDDIVKRAELYLRDGEPIKAVVTANRTLLHELRQIRNHVAHNSTASGRLYINLLQRKFGTKPLHVPSVGEFLLRSDPAAPHRYFLLIYLEEFERMARALAGR